MTTTPEPTPHPSPTVGIVLAAGGGTRLGTPKGLLRGGDGHTWAHHSATVLIAAGCDKVLVVVGAAADAVTATLPSDVEALVAANWADGMSESLRVGLATAALVPDLAQAVIMPVDTPGVSVAAVRHVLDVAGRSPSSLTRAVYRGAPGHPVVIGVGHLRSVLDGLSGDRGANEYLRAHGATEVECSVLASGDDVDTLEALANAKALPLHQRKTEEENRS